MDQTIWNFIFIGITFGVYIGIAIWSRAGSTGQAYIPLGILEHMHDLWNLKRTRSLEVLLQVILECRLACSRDSHRLL